MKITQKNTGTWVSKHDCHTGHNLIFKTPDGVEVWAGGRNRNGGWHLMNPLPQLAIAPSETLGMNLLSSKTEVPEGWSCEQHLTNGTPPHFVSLDWPDFSIPKVSKYFWYALLDDIKEFGIKAEIAGDKIVYRWQANGKAMVATAQKTSREQIQATIQGIWNSRYGGAMDKLSGTWDGMWSNLQDTFTRVFKMIGDAGIFDVLKGELQGVLDSLQAMEADGSLKAFAQTVSDQLVSAFRELKTWVMAVDWKQVWGDLKAFGSGVLKVVNALGGLKGVAIAIAAVFSINLVSSLFLLAKGFVGLLAAMGPIGWAIAAIAAGVYLIYDNWDDIVKWFTDKFNSVLAAFDEGFLQGIWKLWEEFNPVTLIMEAFNGLVKYLFGIDLGKIIGDQIRKVTELMPDWMIEGLGLEASQESAPPATVAPPGALAGAGKQNLNGEMVVRFENTPPGVKVEAGKTNQPGVAMEADVGYRSLAMP